METQRQKERQTIREMLIGGYDMHTEILKTTSRLLGELKEKDRKEYIRREQMLKRFNKVLMKKVM